MENQLFLGAPYLSTLGYMRKQGFSLIWHKKIAVKADKLILRACILRTMFLPISSWNGKAVHKNTEAYVE